ncbi:hypothetical protein Taro_043394, partial [Colocasia esculenta]|nr:hypothetical protein [Colocasia esculenta]
LQQYLWKQPAIQHPQVSRELISAYGCSSSVTSATRAILTNNDFSLGGGGPSECNDMHHNNSECIVVLSTGWYSRGSRCNIMMRITASNRSKTTKVVDECDCMNDCDKEHVYQPPCQNNVADASDAIWNALGLNIDNHMVLITWTMA